MVAIDADLAEALGIAVVMFVVWLGAVAVILGVVDLGRIVDEVLRTVRRRRRAHRARRRRRRNPKR